MTISRRMILFVLASAALACSSDDDSSSAGASTSGAGTSAAGSGARSGSGGTAATAGTSIATGGVGAGSSGACPALRPTEDTSCSSRATVCSYDEIECRCPTGSWSCAEPVDPNCPAIMPAHGSSCTVPEATECEYLADECECTAGLWTCESAEADDAGAPVPTDPPAQTPDAGTPMRPDAGATQCPDLRPFEGLSCTMSAMTCVYDTTACQCPRGMWLCNESVDPTCPIEPPIDGNQCTGRADCDYLDIECECVGNTWNCKAND